MQFIKVSAKVEDRIDTLNQSGKAGRIIANKAINIIENIKSGSIPEYREQLGTCTKYGENRIKNCYKFDFGYGYRMITLHNEETIFIPFLGTHDECQRWLENNRKINKITAGKGTTFRITDNESKDRVSFDDQTADFCDDETLTDLSEQDMRIVFSGLVSGAKKRFG